VNINKKTENGRIYANRRQNPTRKANAGGGMRRCDRSAKEKQKKIKIE